MLPKVALGNSTTNIRIFQWPTLSQTLPPEWKKTGVVLKWTLHGLYRQPCRATWATYFRDLHKKEGVNTWPDFESTFFSFLQRAASRHAGPLNRCKVSSHTHPTLLSHWVQTAFVTSTQQGFSLASVSTQHSTWLAASTTNQFLFARGIS